MLTAYCVNCVIEESMMKKYSACEDIYPAVECRDDSKNRADIANILSIDGDAKFYLASEADEQLRATKRALWMARAERVKWVANNEDAFADYCEEHTESYRINNSYIEPFDEWVWKWERAERKCRQKAEEYK